MAQRVIPYISGQRIEKHGKDDVLIQYRSKTRLEDTCTV